MLVNKMKKEKAMSPKEEVERASQYYYYTDQQMGIDYRVKEFIIQRCAPFIRGQKVLDLGYVDDSWTDVILSKGCEVDIVEGATRHVEHARKRYSGNPKVRIYHSLFQEYQPTSYYDTVIAGDMIRYLPAPLSFLKLVTTWLKDDGSLIITVPNSRSMHRRIGTLMNLESLPTELNQRDREVGNKHCYDRYELRQLLLKSGFTIDNLKGCFLKPLSSSQMENWSDQLLRAFLDIGDELEDYCWFLYAICHK